VLAGGGLIAGATTGLLALTRSNDLHDQCPNNGCPESKRHSLDQARQLALISNVMWGVTALGAGVCLIGILLPDGRDKSDASTTLQVSLTGIDLRGSF
jgi:hypothetical protein